MIRLGIVDFDSSHSIELTRRFNHVDVDDDQQVEGVRVVLGCPGSSEMSPERIPGFAKQIEQCGVQLVEEPAEMLGRIDAVLVLSLCGQAHLERVRPFLEAGIPAYVDKPFACSLADAEEIVRLAAEGGTIVYGSSAIRFSEEIEEFRRRTDRYGAVHGVVSYGPAKRAEGNPGLFHYGIHPTEILYSLMGPGCQRLTTSYTAGAEVVSGIWEDGRVATLRGNRSGATAYGFTAFCTNAVICEQVSTRYAYRNLCRSIVKTFETQRPAVSNQVTVELVKFILASLESERGNGTSVPLDSIL